MGGLYVIGGVPSEGGSQKRFDLFEFKFELGSLSLSFLTHYV